MYYSVYDQQTGGYLHSGRNSKSMEECVEEGLAFLTGDWDCEEVEEFKKITDPETRRAFLENFELVPSAHEEPMEE